MDSNENTNGSSSLRIFKGTLVVVVSLVVLAGVFMTLLSLKRTRLNRNFCRKDDCKEQAMKIKQNMDTSVNPCEHFFNFTCGNYKSETVGTENWALTADGLLYQRYLDTVQNDTQKLSPHVETLQTFHKACLNIYRNNISYNQDLRNILLGLQWPPLTYNWNSDRFNWLNFLEKLIKMGFTNSLLQFSSSSILPEETILCECAPPSAQFDSTNGEKAKQYIRQLIRLLNGEPKFAYEIMQILVQIDKIKIQSMLTLEVITLGELEVRWNMNLIEFGTSIFPRYMNISKSTYIMFINNCPDRLVDFLKRSSKRPVAGYMLIEGIAEFDRNQWITDSKKKNRQCKKLPHDKSTENFDLDLSCYYFNMKVLSDLWLYVYVKKYSSKARKDKVLKMLDLIIDEGRALINNSWLSAPSKKVIFNKISNHLYMIDHDEEFVSDEHIQSTFGNLKFNASDFINSEMRLKAQKFLRQWKAFTVNVDKREIFHLHDQIIVNAFNNRLSNVINIPASCLMPILYSDDFEDSLNFGGLGSVLAHEFFHTLDNASLEYDDKHANVLWINKKDRPLFDEKVNCFVKQYNNYNLTSELHVDGHYTINENLADSGMILAYRAYLKWLETHEVKKLTGLGNYNNRQMFWIALGNMYCSVYTKEYMESDFVKNDIHAVGKFRILGSLSNFEEFSKDFNCPANSYMNPKTKCKLYH